MEVATKNTTVNNVALCVTGWYYPVDFYAFLTGLPQVDVFVVSHKYRAGIPDKIFDLIPSDNFLLKPNIGYDWGCYQQFISTGLWRNYEYIIFMHDDLIIYDGSFIDESIRLLNSGKKFVGNGINNTKTDWAYDYNYIYAPFGWKPPSRGFTHETLRGSFIATTRQALERVKNFEVFWDWLHINIRFGNWSLISTCGKIEDIFGEGCFGFLGDEYCKSEYLVEMVRGNLTQQTTGQPRYVYDTYITLCKWYMTIYNKAVFNSILKLIKPLLYLISGRGVYALLDTAKCKIRG